MASKIQIYNLALSNIGMKKISDLSTFSPSLEACNLHYLDALKDTYSEYDWSFATVKKQFPLVSSEVVGWSYLYPYPPKAAGVQYVFSEANCEYRAEKEFEIVFLPDENKKVICSDEAEAWVEYTHIVEDTTLFSSKFVIALGYKLSAMIAHQLTADPNVAMNMRNMAIGVVNEAKRVNFKEKVKRPEQSNEIVNARS